ncbi:hypothetical protein PCC9214_05494 (plasmid) [Planktothrix tepida]|uniref:Uncharacterized protein n=1 Tax=Planktothrix tepida PCC 9214 TaxID=671072 RepID=A0A1J1LE71_9CYAN|nr:hypothetical protein [Planktothrix tepida]CAD5989023.1 hypothetical protein PCC9214_05494 [Planktothrix tepida]CUR30266.1 hypothetical protein PL9214100010 [Planktothrix tepida PCC 9214]
MQTININPVSSELDDSKPKLILLKGIAIATLTVSLIGGIIHVVSRGQSITQAPNSEQVKPGNGRRELKALIQPSEQSSIVVKKPQKPVIVEEGSEAYYCIKNNGGDGCLNRDRFAPNFKVIAPPKPQKTYEDYLVQYGVRSGDCGRYLNGKPNCF